MSIDVKSLTIKVERDLVEIRSEWDQIGNEIETILSSDPTNRNYITFPSTEGILLKLSEITKQIELIKENITRVDAKKRIYFVTKIEQMEEEHKNILEEISMKEFEKKEFIDKMDDRFKKNEERVGMRKTRMGLYQKENQSLINSETLVHDIAENINATVFMIEEQNSRMSRIRNKWNDMNGLLGLSRNVMNMITSRNTKDKVIVYGGLILIIIVIVALYCFIKYLKN